MLQTHPGRCQPFRTGSRPNQMPLNRLLKCSLDLLLLKNSKRLQVFSDKQLEVVPGFNRNQPLVADDGMLQCRRTRAAPLAFYDQDGLADDVLCHRHVVFYYRKDRLDRHILMGIMPAVIIGGQGYYTVAAFRLPGQLCFSLIGHANDRNIETAVHLRFGACGEGRTFHADIGSPPVHRSPDPDCSLVQHRRKIRTYRVGKLDMGHNAVTEKGIIANPLGPVDKLIGNDYMPRYDLLPHAPYRRDRYNPLNPKALHAVDIRAVID